jgi:hypothetical protein
MAKKKAVAPKVTNESITGKVEDIIKDCEEMAKGAVNPARYHNIAKIFKQIKRNNLR